MDRSQDCVSHLLRIDRDSICTYVYMSAYYYACLYACVCMYYVVGVCMHKSATKVCMYVGVHKMM